MRIIVTGSIAYDYVMVFPGQFQDHILPEKMHILSVSFLVDSMKRLQGGTAANIAYNLALVGEQPEVVGAVGRGLRRLPRLARRPGVDTAGIKVVAGDFTSSCFINTDLKHNQITAFYPGAMKHAASIHLADIGPDARRPRPDRPQRPRRDGRPMPGMHRAGHPLPLRPVDAGPPDDGRRAGGRVRGAKVLTGNDYEFGMMAEKLGITEAELPQGADHRRHQGGGRRPDHRRRPGIRDPAARPDRRGRPHRRRRRLSRRARHGDGRRGSRGRSSGGWGRSRPSTRSSRSGRSTTSTPPSRVRRPLPRELRGLRRGRLRCSAAACVA